MRFCGMGIMTRGVFYSCCSFFFKYIFDLLTCLDLLRIFIKIYSYKIMGIIFGESFA